MDACADLARQLRYRVSLFDLPPRYVSATPQLYKQAGDFAYADVDRAFTYFLEHYSKANDVPFIISEPLSQVHRARIQSDPASHRRHTARAANGCGLSDRRRQFQMKQDGRD